MKPAGEPALLRPLSLGEIFDRAVTLHVRNFALFSLIALVLVVPVAILQYFVGLHESGTFAQLLAQIQHPGKTPPPADTTASAGAFGLIGISVGLQAFTVVAIAAAIGRIYRGERPEWSACCAQALRRTGAILLTLICEIAMVGVVIFIGAIAMTLVFVAAFFLVRTSAALGIALFAAAVAIGLAWLAAMLLCYLAFGFAYNALGIEDASFGAAIARGFSRVFNRSELIRALLICLALLVIYFGLAAVSMSVALLLETLNLHVVNVIVSALISLITTAFLGILLSVYYFDVRIRREGLDMQAEIAGLQPIASVP